MNDLPVWEVERIRDQYRPVTMINGSQTVVQVSCRNDDQIALELWQALDSALVLLKDKEDLVAKLKAALEEAENR